MNLPPVVGRRGAVRSLTALVGGAAAGEGGALALLGEAGMGKTTLVALAVSAATSRGVPVVRVDVPPDGPPLGAVVGALADATRGRPAPVDDTALGPYLPVLGRLVPHWAPGGTPLPEPTPEHPVVLAEGVLRLLAHLGAGSGLLVVFEDVHWADPATLSIVGHVAGRAGATGIAVVVTARDDEGPPPGLPPEVTPINLEPLTVDDVATLAGILGSDPDVDAADVHARSGGVPLLVEALLAPDGTRSDAYPRIVRGRLDGLLPAHRRVIEAAAVMGGFTDTWVVATVAGVDHHVVADAVAAGVGRGLLVDDGERVRFRHDLTRRAVLTGTTSVRRRALSAAAGEASADRATGPADLLRAGRLLADGGRSAEALGCWDAAAVGALAARRTDLAVAAWREALTLELGDTDRRRVSLALARTLAGQGEAAEAAALTGVVLAMAQGVDPADEAEACLVGARAATDTGDWDRAGWLVSRCRDLRPDAGTLRACEVIEARVALGRAGPGDRAMAAHRATAVAGVARAAGDRATEAEALLVAGVAARASDLHVAVGLLAAAVDAARAAGSVPLRLAAMNELGATELLRDATSDRLEEVLAEAERTGAVGLAVSVKVNLAAHRLMTGRLTEALALAGEVHGTAAALGLTPLVAVAELHRGLAAALGGDRRTMEVHLGRAEQAAPDDPDLGTAAWAVGRGVGALIAEDRAEARRALRTAARVATDTPTAFLSPHEGPALLVAAVEGRADPATVDGAMSRVPRGSRYHELWTGAAAATVAGRTDPVLAGGRLEDALAAGAPYPVFGAVVRRLVAEAQLADGWGDPAGVVRPAWLIAGERGLTALEAACGGLLRRAGAPAPRRRATDAPLPEPLARAGVTGREAEVLAQLADRPTNRQLAERLYCSPRTVEKHVAALAAKLGTDRAGLVALSRRLSSPPSGPATP